MLRIWLKDLLKMADEEVPDDVAKGERSDQKRDQQVCSTGSVAMKVLPRSSECASSSRPS